MILYPKSCPICEGSYAVPNKHSCKKYWDEYYNQTTNPVVLQQEQGIVYQPTNLAGKTQNDTIQISLKLIMEIYAELSTLQNTDLANRLLKESTGQSVTTRGK